MLTMMRKILFSFLLFCALGYINAQSNNVLDEFLSREKADFSSAVYLVMAASGAVPEDVPVPVALQALVQKNWGLSIENPDRPLVWGEYSILLMKAFGLQGGVIYRLLGNQRYSAREMNFRRLLPYEKNPAESLTPYEALLALQTLMGDLNLEGQVQG